jgi:hypothetical protein
LRSRSSGVFSVSTTTLDDAVFTVEHREDPDTELAERIALAAINAIDGVDADRGPLYVDMVVEAVPNVIRHMEDMMRPVGYEYQSKFARRFYGEGKDDGRLEGRLEVILEQLISKFGPLPDEIQTRVRGAEGAELLRLAKRMLTAHTREEALGPLG